MTALHTASPTIGAVGSGAEVVRFNAAENAVLSGVSAGTALGDALRRYWVPALLSVEVPNADAPPVRLRLLGQDLIVFRDSAGRVGVLDEHCVHRGASLFYGRVADGGIQCVYHGWSFDVTGRCLAAPTCPQLAGDPRLAQPAYTAHEAGGLIFVHLGDPSDLPPLPDLGWLQVGDGARFADKRFHPCHWLQALEADTDSAHVAYLHRENLLDAAADPLVAVMLEQTAPQIEVDTTEYGLMLAAHRELGADSIYTRVNHWLAPWYTVVPAENPEGLLSLHAWVPVDEENSLIFSLMWHPERDLTTEQRTAMEAGRLGIFPELLPDGFVARRNAANEYEIDRSAQALGSPWSGVSGNQEQDDAITASMGPAFDRTREILVGTDAAVIAVRRALLDTAAAHRDGQSLIGLEGHGFDVPSVFYEVERGADFRDGLMDLMAAKQVAPRRGSR